MEFLLRFVIGGNAIARDSGDEPRPVPPDSMACMSRVRTCVSVGARPLAGHDRDRFRSPASRTACPAGGCSGLCGCRLFRFPVLASVMTAHTLPPAAIHRHASVS